METTQVIGRKIRIERLNRNLTMDELSCLSGITRATLSCIENGNGNYSIHNLLNVLNYLNLSIGILQDTPRKVFKSRATRQNLKIDKKINRFVIMCVEMYSDYKKINNAEIYKKFNELGITSHLVEYYEDLHGMGYEYLNEYIDEMIGK